MEYKLALGRSWMPLIIDVINPLRPFPSSTRKVGFLVLYKADIVLKFWLTMGGLGHCRNLKVTLMTHEIPN
jgi:hypothetical protein